MSRTIDGRLAYADLLRVLSILAVVFLHLSGSQLAGQVPGSAAFQAFNVYDSLARWAVPVFVMLSGMFLLDPKRPMPLSKLFFHNILRIAAALLVWGTVYGFVDGKVFSPWGLWTAFLGVLRGDLHYHLWFLPMILGLYLITPVLRAFVKGASRSDFHWFFLLVFVFAMALPTAAKLWPNAAALPMTWLSKLDLHLILGYAGYYVAGYYLKEYTLGGVAETLSYVLGILGAVVTVFGTSALSAAQGGLRDDLYDYMAPNVCFMAVAVFVLFRYVLGVSDERSRRQRLGGLAQITFGVYLVHDLFIQLFENFGLTTLSFAPALSVPVLALAVFVCACAVAWVLSKIPVVGRYLT